MAWIAVEWREDVEAKTVISGTTATIYRRRVVVTAGGDAGDGAGARRWGLNTHHGWTLALTDADVAPGDVEGGVGAIG